MARWVLLLVALCLSACATKPVVTRSEHLFDDALFKAASVRIDAADVLRLSPAMKAYLQREQATSAYRREPHRALLDALYNRNQLQLHYDTGPTRNAAEAFDRRAGNCMSLVIMTAAFAHELGLQVRYQSVYTDTNWGRRGDLYFAIGHINLSVGRSLIQTRNLSDSPDWLTVDFLPQRDLRGQRYDVIDEPTLIAILHMSHRRLRILALVERARKPLD